MTSCYVYLHTLKIDKNMIYDERVSYKEYEIIDDVFRREMRGENGSREKWRKSLLQKRQLVWAARTGHQGCRDRIRSLTATHTRRYNRVTILTVALPKFFPINKFHVSRLFITQGRLINEEMTRNAGCFHFFLSFLTLFQYFTEKMPAVMLRQE